MKRRAIPALALAAALAASGFGAASAQAAGKNSAEVTYIALGDSYPAGAGLTTGQEAYPALLGDVHYATVDAHSAAASGDSTYDVLFDHTTGGAKVVTVTVGADDLDWGKALMGDPTALAALPDRMQALAGVPNGATAPDGEPVLSIPAVIAGIRTANPDATILVTSYVHLFGSVATSCTIGGPAPVSAAQAAFANNGVDQLNAVIKGGVMAYDAAAHTNAVKYVDATGTFAGHALCDTDTPWLFDMTKSAPFHLTARGQKAYAQAIQQQGFQTAALAASRS
ncbi:GDSL-type esterase/lipase family protein [Raineyella fluvialis]|uniref:SGNH hydrolase-type esterase domain-containing protein n=1 Tax=Raineyella fluvialis TaxID=2662261 RepID=A0A5Q2FEY8_9ACTN|nr:GDSL-type esterase/lipase family protein [Raineyella fluvialis]QGF23285.1 hypothetical protein Rai3103_05970 [Raineyella fluvialis]